MNLYLTKAGVYAGTQKDAGKGHMAVEVPTDKQGLIAYLNGVMGSLPSALAAESAKGCPSCDGLNTSCPEGCGRDQATGELNGTTLIMRDPTGQQPDVALERDGHPVARTAFTQAQVDGMFSRMRPELRELAHEVSKLPANDLGVIAFEVGHALAKRGIGA